MALIECPDCKREVSSRAKACPNCGFCVAEYLKINEMDEEDRKEYLKARVSERKLTLDELRLSSMEDFDLSDALTEREVYEFCPYKIFFVENDIFGVLILDLKLREIRVENITGKKVLAYQNFAGKLFAVHNYTKEQKIAVGTFEICFTDHFKYNMLSFLLWNADKKFIESSDIKDVKMFYQNQKDKEKQIVEKKCTVVYKSEMLLREKKQEYVSYVIEKYRSLDIDPNTFHTDDLFVEFKNELCQMDLELFEIVAGMYYCSKFINPKVRFKNKCEEFRECAWEFDDVMKDLTNQFNERARSNYNNLTYKLNNTKQDSQRYVIMTKDIGLTLLTHATLALFDSAGDVLGEHLDRSDFRDKQKAMIYVINLRWTEKFDNDIKNALSQAYDDKIGNLLGSLCEILGISKDDYKLWKNSELSSEFVKNQKMLMNSKLDSQKKIIMDLISENRNQTSLVKNAIFGKKAREKEQLKMKWDFYQEMLSGLQKYPLVEGKKEMIHSFAMDIKIVQKVLQEEDSLLKEKEGFFNVEVLFDKYCEKYYVKTCSKGIRIGWMSSEFTKQIGMYRKMKGRIISSVYDREYSIAEIKVLLFDSEQ